MRKSLVRGKQTNKKRKRKKTLKKNEENKNTHKKRGGKKSMEENEGKSYWVGNKHTYKQT